MALELPTIPQIFKHSRDFDTGVGNVRKGQGEIIVALDGSGDFDNIQEAVNSVTMNEGAVIFIKRGTYEITSTITINKNNIKIIGSGLASVIRRKTAAAYTLITIGNGGTARTNITIEALGINDIGGGAVSDGININHAHFVWIKNCYFTNIHDSVITVNGDNIWIENCYLSGGDSSNLAGTNICFLNNVADGLNIGSSYSKIIGNSFSQDVIISGDYNVFVGNYKTDSDESIKLNVGADNNVVVANVITDPTGVNNLGAGNIVANNYISP